MLREKTRTNSKAVQQPNIFYRLLAETNFKTDLKMKVAWSEILVERKFGGISFSMKIITKISFKTFLKQHRTAFSTNLCDIFPYLPSLPDLSGVSQFKQPSPGLTILVCFLPVSTNPLFFLCLRLNGQCVSATCHCQLQSPAHFLKPQPFTWSAAKYCSFSIGKLNHLTY